MAACDLDVSAPGVITDDDLTLPTAGPVILIGLVGDVETAINRLMKEAGVASDELESFGTRAWYTDAARGTMTPEWADVGWNLAARARWTTTTGIDRLRVVDETTGAEAARIAAAHVWAGYAFRIGGDLFCDFVFDGGAAEPNRKYYESARDYFTDGLSMVEAIGAELDSLRLAAHAGLAQTYLILGDFELAERHASEVPDDFLWVAHRTALAANWIWEETNIQFQNTVWNTPIEDLGPDGDPRVPWVDMDRLDSGGVAPFFKQLKYPTRDSNIPLAKGWEMRLIEAEVELRAGNVDRATQLVNYVRAAFGMEEATADSEDEAWAALDHERLVTLWLEGRRLRDNARFYAEGRHTFLEGRDKCWPIGISELTSNPNL